MSGEVSNLRPVPRQATGKPSLAPLEIRVLQQCAENDVSAISHEDERGTSPSLDEACQIVRKLLDQVVWNDAPPSNEEQARLGKAYLKPAASPSSISRPLYIQPQITGKESIEKVTVNSDDAFETWTEHYQLRCNQAERKLGNVAFATLCARTLETVGTSGRPSREAMSTVSGPRQSPKLSPWRNSSPKMNWLIRRSQKTPLGLKANGEGHDDGKMPTSATTEADNNFQVKREVERSRHGSTETRDGVDHPAQPLSIATDDLEPNRLQMFGSEYARYLSATVLAPKDATHRPTSYQPKTLYNRRRGASKVNKLEDSSMSVATGAITDMVVTYGNDPQPKGYYRIAQSCAGDDTPLRDSKTDAFINVKKEPNWDRAAQRPCVTALAIIFPERKEFVPPGFCLVRRYEAIPNSSSESVPANLNPGGEPVFLCFRRSREGNPLTGLIPLQPSKREAIPEGYTVIERTPRNFVANIQTAGVPVFLSYRQRLANLETLRPFPLVMSVKDTKSGTPLLQGYYCTGGTVVESKVGRFHIMDRSTHSLLSPSSVSTRLSLIEVSRRKALTSISDLPSVINSTYSSSASHPRPPRSTNELLTSSLLLEYGLGTPGSRSIISDFEKLSSTGDFESIASSSDQPRSVISQDNDFRLNGHLSYSSASEASSIGTPMISPLTHPCDSNLSASDTPLHRCLEALSFIPIVSTAVDGSNAVELLHFQSRVAILTPILTACYTRHGGSTLIAIEGLSTLLKSKFFSSDVVKEQDSFSRLTMLDTAVQVVCDVATMGTQETHLQACVEFVQAAVRYGCGHLNARTVGYTLRFYLFVFYFGASIPTVGSYPFCGLKKGSDCFMLEDPRRIKSTYLPGGAPQSAALSLKDLIIFSIGRLHSLAVSKRATNANGADPEMDRGNPPEIFNKFLAGLIDGMVDDSVSRVDMANYTQLALHQIHRSGGSELFWYDMMNSCGPGLFANDTTLTEEGKNMFILCFAILTNLVKLAFSKSRRKSNDETVPRCLVSKLLSLELLQIFLEAWRDEQSSLKPSGSRSITTFAFCIRRLVVPCLLFNTRETLDEPRVHRRVIRIVGILWCSPFYRGHMKLELGILLEHFVLRMLELGPQLPTKVAKSRVGSPQLLEQQIELMQEIRVWFSLGSRDLPELFLNFDGDASSQMSGPIKLFSGIQWKIWQRLSASLCSIAEVCGTLIGDQIRQSQAIASPKTDFDAVETFDGGSARDRVAAQRLRKAALEAIAQMVKCIAESAAKASGSQRRVESQSWKGTQNQRQPPQKQYGKATTSVDSDAYVCNNMDGGQCIDTPAQSAPAIAEYWKRALASTDDGVRTSPKGHYSPKHGASKKLEDKTVQVYSGIGRLHQEEEEAGKIDHLGIALDIAKNKSLNKAIDYLIACNVLTTSPRDIASFLRIHKEDLSSDVLGRYLGEGGIDGSETEYWNLIRFNYIRANSFVGMNVEKGLRHLLTNCGFRLPGEAQQIDRIMTTFAQCFWEDNAGDQYRCPFQDQDTVFLLSYAIIILNTDLHKSGQAPSSSHRNKQRKKMTKSEFIANLRGVISVEELAPEYLSEVYDSIEDHPIALQDSGASESSTVVSESLSTMLSGMLDNVKTVDALLRALAIHEYRFITIDDASEACRADLGDLTQRCFAKTWHQFHGLINTALEIAHLDLQGMQPCLDIMKYALSVTVLLEMPMERAAFMGQLGRFKLFNSWRRGEGGGLSPNHESFKQDDWYLSIETACSQAGYANGVWPALEKLNDLTCELRSTLAVDVKDRKTLSYAVGRLRNGEFLMNDPVRAFIREGNLLKRSNRSGRSVEYRFFLFSDMLIYAKKIGSSDAYKIHEELPLILMKVVDWFPPDMKKESKRAFQIYHPRKKFMVLCSTGEERKSWVTSVRTAIEKELERKVSIEAARMAAAKSH